MLKNLLDSARSIDAPDFALRKMNFVGGMCSNRSIGAGARFSIGVDEREMSKGESRNKQKKGFTKKSIFNN